MKRVSRTRTIVNFIASIIITTGIIYIASVQISPLPPLGATFNPGTGVWTAASDAQIPSGSTLHLQGLEKPVHIILEQQGTAHIVAASDHDLFMAIGYMHAKNRLFQMDLMRRQGEGLLSEIIGPDALSSDTFEDKLGLQRAAQANWSQMAPDDPGRQVFTAYTQGVNDVITEDKATGHLPLMFKILGYQPAQWTPVDILVIQEILTQTLTFTTSPLDYTLLAKTLGYQRTMQWFPIIPINEQHPYDLGPYPQDGIQAIPSSLTANIDTCSQACLTSTYALLSHFQTLPSNTMHWGSDSNNWAVNGPKSVSGNALMAGDPHLDQTLPSIWYQLDCESPHYQFKGVSIPGTPIVPIGSNKHISWSMTNVQNQSTFYYQEKTDAAHPNSYFWNGAWHEMQDIHYSIPVQGRQAVDLTVKLTVHGPVLTPDGLTMSVWWVGALPSPDVDASLQILQSSNFQQFRQALQKWYAPSLNFIYADDQGNIGMLSAGYYPQVKSGNPWMPLSGTGEADVIGTIPFNDLPQVYNPPSHFVFSANQRIVSADYPYYIGTSLDFFDDGSRAAKIYHTLSEKNQLTVADMEHLQQDTHDYLAQVITPQLIQALKDQPLSPIETQASTLLTQWDANVSTNSAAASIWSQFWNQYVYDVFHPWWENLHVPVKQDSHLAVLSNRVTSTSDILGEDVQQWTLHDPENAAFSLPDGTKRTASSVMKQAFKETVAQLAKQLGTQPTNWQWSRIHSQKFSSLAQIPSLDYSAYASGGDANTVNAAEGGNVATAGPTWRMIIDWSTHQGIAIYPGGQSENPVSPWYSNQIELWRRGEYFPLLSASQAQSQSTSYSWTLQS